MDEQDFTLAVKQSLQPLLWFFIGVLVAVGMHLGQNALYFQSFTKATADLFGSAGTRMGIDTRELNPDYYKHIQNVTPDTISRVSITVKMWKTFWRIFAWKRQIFVLILILAALAGYSIYADRRVRKRFVMNSLLIALLCFLSVGAWIWLMPLHAYHHVHFLPRHFFISLLLLIMGMLFLTFSKPEKDAMVVKNNP